MSSTIFEVLEQGPIVAGDEDMGLLVTINGSYLNLWVARQVADRAIVRWDNKDSRPTGKDMYSMTSAEAWDLGKAYLAEVLTPEGETEEDR